MLMSKCTLTLDDLINKSDKGVKLMAYKTFKIMHCGLIGHAD